MRNGVATAMPFLNFGAPDMGDDLEVKVPYGLGRGIVSRMQVMRKLGLSKSRAIKFGNARLGSGGWQEVRFYPR